MLQIYTLTVTPLEMFKENSWSDSFTEAPADAEHIDAFRIRAAYGGTTFFQAVVCREYVLTTMRLVQPMLRQVGPIIDQAEVDRQRREVVEEEEATP